MAKLRNFTLEGNALRLTAFEDHHGNKLFDAQLLPEFDRKTMTVEQLIQFREAIRRDIDWNGVLGYIDSQFVEDTLSKFLGEEDKEDGVRMRDVLEG